MLLEGVCTSFIINFFLFSTTNKVGKYFRAGMFSKKWYILYLFSRNKERVHTQKVFKDHIFIIYNNYIIKNRAAMWQAHNFSIGCTKVVHIFIIIIFEQ